jgi:hypothetical protein
MSVQDKVKKTVTKKPKRTGGLLLPPPAIESLPVLGEVLEAEEGEDLALVDEMKRFASRCLKKMDSAEAEELAYERDWAKGLIKRKKQKKAEPAPAPAGKGTKRDRDSSGALVAPPRREPVQPKKPAKVVKKRNSGGMFHANHDDMWEE